MHIGLECQVVYLVWVIVLQSSRLNCLVTFGNEAESQLIKGYIGRFANLGKQ